MCGDYDCYPFNPTVFNDTYFLCYLKVEEKRKQREESFRKIELEALLLDNNDDNNNIDDMPDDIDIDDDMDMNHDHNRNKNNNDDKDKNNDIASKQVKELFDMIDSKELLNLRKKSIEKMKRQLVGSAQQDEEEYLGTLSLRELYEMTIQERSASSYQIQRAQHLIDENMNYLRLKKNKKSKKDEL